jgi:hypothetical protein
MQATVSIGQVNELLADRLEELLPELIGGHAAHGEWITASTKEGGLGDSLVVVLKGRKRGLWYHHAAGVGGDPLGLVNYVRFHNADISAALRWARQYLGGAIQPESDADRKVRSQLKAKRERADEEERHTQRQRARRLFFGADTRWRGTPAWHYLNNRLCGRLDRLGRPPACIRFAPSLLNAQLGRELPAMLAAIVEPNGTVVAVHRTWLVKRDLDDATWDRLRETDATATPDGKPLAGKKVLGSWKGAAIHIWPGGRVDRRTGEVRRGLPWSRLVAGEEVTLAEGIETALTLALIAPERRVACVVSSEGFASVVLPPAFNRVVVAADRDPGNKATATAIERAERTFAASGRHSVFTYPPAPFDDWNSVLHHLCAPQGA